jgi:uroporphyrinogen-III synthase
MTEPCWVLVTRRDNIPPREGRAVTIAGREIAIFNLGARFLATDNRCPHRGGPLCDGIVTGAAVACPLHAWKVNLETGAVERPAGGNGCIRTYPTRVDDDVIVIGLTWAPPSPLGTSVPLYTTRKPTQGARRMMGTPSVTEKSDIEFLHEIGSRIAAADPFHAVLSRVVSFVASLVKCDSCFVYVLDHEGDLVLRASKNPHPEVVDRLKLRVGQGITGWVAEHRQPVAVGAQAFQDPRFQVFIELPEDRYEAFLSVPVLSRGKLVGVINVQHRQPHNHTRREIQLISTIGFLVGAEIEMARLEVENSQLSEQLEARKVIDRAKGILQRELGITEEDAYLTIQRQSRQRRKTKKEIAEAIIIGDELRRGKSAS